MTCISLSYILYINKSPWMTGMCWSFAHFSPLWNCSQGIKIAWRYYMWIFTHWILGYLGLCIPTLTNSTATSPLFLSDHQQKLLLFYLHLNWHLLPLFFNPFSHLASKLSFSFSSLPILFQIICGVYTKLRILVWTRHSIYIFISLKK